MGWIPRIELGVNLAIWEGLVIFGGGTLIAPLANDGGLSRLLSLPILVIGGEISYSIYMTYQVVNEAILSHIEGLSILLTFAIVTSVTILISTLLLMHLNCRRAMQSSDYSAARRIVESLTR